jgi:hypothetical protein
MSETNVLEEIVENDGDWAVLPFDEAEDDERWALLFEETERLDEDVAEFEADYGEKILMNEPLPEIQTGRTSEDLGDLF